MDIWATQPSSPPEQRVAGEDKVPVRRSEPGRTGTRGNAQKWLAQNTQGHYAVRAQSAHGESLQ